MTRNLEANQPFQVVNNGFAADIASDATMSLSTNGTTYSAYDETLTAGHVQVTNIQPGTFVKLSVAATVLL